MRLLGYRELFWDVSPDRSLEGLVVTAYEDESSAVEVSLEASAASGAPLDLSRLLAHMSVSPGGWTRRRISVDEARTVGDELWAALPPYIAEPLREDAGFTRLKISASTPSAGDLPWELLSDGAGKPLALRPNFVLARTVPLRFPVHPLSVEPPLRVLLLVPNPKDERLLDADAEIASALEAMPPPGFDVRVLDVSWFETLALALGDFQPHVVHYVGHGGLTQAEGNLILQDVSGSSRWVSSTELAQVLPSSVRLLCLATPCTAENYEVLGLAHLARGSSLTTLPTTVANQYPVDRAVADVFWKAFYTSLVEEGNANVAVHKARMHAAAVEPAYADWGSFSLVIRDQTGVCFEIRSSQDAADRRAGEVRAQFAAETANELAQQVQALGDEIPEGLGSQYEIAQERLAKELDELKEA